MTELARYFDLGNLSSILLGIYAASPDGVEMLVDGGVEKPVYSQADKVLRRVEEIASEGAL